jgi:putative aldouronate transport system permease protein
MFGIILAFRRYTVGDSIFGSKWVGFKYFITFTTDPVFWSVFKNTFLLSFYNLLFGFPLPIVFALLLNEIRTKITKKFVQTVSYLPRFFSTVVVVSMMHVILSPSSGIINLILKYFGLEPVHFLLSLHGFALFIMYRKYGNSWAGMQSYI